MSYPDLWLTAWWLPEFSLCRPFASSQESSWNLTSEQSLEGCCRSQAGIEELQASCQGTSSELTWAVCSLFWMLWEVKACWILTFWRVFWWLVFRQASPLALYLSHQWLEEPLARLWSWSCSQFDHRGPGQPQQWTTQRLHQGFSGRYRRSLLALGRVRRTDRLLTSPLLSP